MPYKDIKDLPSAVKDNLPVKAQEIYKKAFNSAFKEYGKDQEVIAHKVAWSAVKKSYHKNEKGKWVLNG